MSVGLLAVGFVGNCMAWWCLSLWGRRRIYNIGLLLMTVTMFALGFLDLAPDYTNKKGVIWAECILLVRDICYQIRYTYNV